MSVATEYEYAGFRYVVTVVGDDVRVVPVAGQHPAASKEKHIRAARECFLEDAGRH